MVYFKYRAADKLKRKTKTGIYLSTQVIMNQTLTFTKLQLLKAG